MLLWALSVVFLLLYLRAMLEGAVLPAITCAILWPLPALVALAPWGRR